MLLPWVFELFGGEQVEVLADPPPGDPGFDDVIHVSPDGSGERVAELLDILLLLLLGSLTYKF